MVKNVRMRLLLVMQVLTEQTDEKHGLTMKEILEWITEKGIAGERKSVYCLLYTSPSPRDCS